MASSYGGSIFSFLRTPTLFSAAAASVSSPTDSAQGSLFAASSPTPVTCRFVDVGHSDRYEVISHRGFDLHFHEYERCCISFHMSVGHPYVLPRETFIRVLCPLFNWITIIIIIRVKLNDSLYILYINSLWNISLANIFSYSLGHLLVLLMIFFTVQKYLVWCSPTC